jgi:hypothetical protein
MAGDNSLGINVEGADRLQKAIGALADGRDEMVERIGEVLYRLAEDRAQSAAIRVLGEPVHGEKRTGLREEVASGVGLRDISGGTEVTTSMPEDKASIPRGFDTAVSFRPQRGTWRHPLFGDRSNWYRSGPHQEGFSWFIGAFDGADEDGRARLEQMLDDVIKGIAGEIDY